MFRAGVWAKVRFFMVQVPFPQMAKGQLTAWGGWSLVMRKAWEMQTRAIKTRRDFMYNNIMGHQILLKIKTLGKTCGES